MSLSREELIRMAREAGLIRAEDSYLTDGMERFASLVAVAEREACAKVCIEMGTEPMEWQPSTLAVRPDNFAVAQAIRARGNGGGK